MLELKFEINPFILCSTREQVIFRQYADREKWIALCLPFGADLAALEAYDWEAAGYAAAALYPYADVIAYCRRLAHEALARGETLPETAEQAIEAENTRQFYRLFGGR